MIGGQSHWICRCDCGTEKRVRSTHLKTGNIKSCGCQHIALLTASMTKHGQFKDGRSTAEAAALQTARDRCRNPKSHAYKDYGERGITMCERWISGEGDRSGLECFLIDMGPKPRGLTLERKDNSKGYSPDNCEWDTRKKQARNRRSNVIVEFRGERMCVSEAAERAGINVYTVRNRLYRGWPVEKALSTQPLR